MALFPCGVCAAPFCSLYAPNQGRDRFYFPVQNQRMAGIVIQLDFIQPWLISTFELRYMLHILYCHGTELAVILS